MSDTTTPQYRAIPNPAADVDALLATALALKENVDSLTRQRGDPQVWAATVREVTTGAAGDNNFPTNAAYLRGLVEQAQAIVAAVSQAMGLKVNRVGDVMGGPLTLSGNPTEGRHAATKDYVDLNGATDWNDIPNRPVAFPPKPHNHSINDTIDLRVELDNRALLNHTQSYATLTLPEGADAQAVIGWRLTWSGTAFILQPPAQSYDHAGLWAGAAPPLNTQEYPFWFDPTAGSLYVTYDDGDSRQWVPAISDRAISVYLQAQERITQLETKNAALNQALLDLTARVTALET